MNWARKLRPGQIGTRLTRSGGSDGVARRERLDLSLSLRDWIAGKNCSRLSTRHEGCESGSWEGIVSEALRGTFLSRLQEKNNLVWSLPYWLPREFEGLSMDLSGQNIPGAVEISVEVIA